MATVALSKNIHRRAGSTIRDRNGTHDPNKIGDRSNSLQSPLFEQVAPVSSDFQSKASWQPSSDIVERVIDWRRWMAVYDDDTQPDDVRAQAWARAAVCAGEVLASDGTPWLSLAQ